MDYVISGDSHGPVMVGVLRGFPSGFEIDIEAINEDLKLRQSPYGRSKRMLIEEDRIEIVSGIYNSLTTGAPLTLLIKNKASNTETSPRYMPRPGHGDYSAYTKYKLKDLNAYAERNSARWTCVLTAIGSISRQVLNYFGIDVVAYTKKINNVEFFLNSKNIAKIRELRNLSEVFCPDGEVSKEMKKEIDKAIENGDTVGGEVEIISTPLIAGLGDYSSMDLKVDSKLSALLMGIPSVKGILFGKKIYDGSKYMDPFVADKDSIKRLSNNCGGIEGGFTNGEPVNITLFVKPIPTLRKGLPSLNLSTLEPANAPYIRSDATSVPAVAIISEAAVSYLLLSFIMQRYGSGHIDDIKKRIQDGFRDL